MFADPLSLETISVRSFYGAGKTDNEVWSCDIGPACHRIDSALLYAGGNSREFHDSELVGLYEEVIEERFDKVAKVQNERCSRVGDYSLDHDDSGECYNIKQSATSPMDRTGAG